MKKNKGCEIIKHNQFKKWFQIKTCRDKEISNQKNKD